MRVRTEPRFIVYKDRKGEWRWRLKAANGRNIARSSEGYKKRSQATKMIHYITFIISPIIVSK